MIRRYSNLKSILTHRAVKWLVCLLFIAMCSVPISAQHSNIDISIPDTCAQLVCVDVTQRYNCVVTLRERSHDGLWTTVATMDGTVGYGGVIASEEKREGDGKSPIGIFALRRGLCYEKDFESDFPMEVYDERYMWCEDVESADYNTLVRDPAPDTTGDRLWQRRETQYRYIVVVEYNTNPIVRGAGSAIFIHAWRAPGKPTAGCIGVAEQSMRRIVEWLDPNHNPHILIH